MKFSLNWTEFNKINIAESVGKSFQVPQQPPFQQLHVHGLPLSDGESGFQIQKA